MSVVYPSNCADLEDYIQIGYLKLIEIQQYKKYNFNKYAITSIKRAIRNAAIQNSCIISASKDWKKLTNIIRMALNRGMTENEVCDEFNIDHKTFSNLKSLILVHSLDSQIDQLITDPIQFNIIKDILSSKFLDNNDLQLILSQLNGDCNQKYSRQTIWRKLNNIKNKLMMSGYGN